MSDDVWSQDEVDAIRWRAHLQRRRLGFSACVDLAVLNEKWQLIHDLIAAQAPPEALLAALGEDSPETLP